MLRANKEKYPSEIMEGVKKVIEELSETELDVRINSMTKAEVMDKYIESIGGQVSSSEICRVVDQIFGFDLDTKPILSKKLLSSKEIDPSIPLSRYVMNSYLNKDGMNKSGAEIRTMVNDIFGINLEAISSLEKARISLYSKDQWVVHHEHNLFVVHTGAGDVDAWVYPTEYFIKKTGITELPKDLQNSLTGLGYTLNEEKGSYYYANPTGDAVSDAFKGQTMGAIIKVIQSSYKQL